MVEPTETDPEEIEFITVDETVGVVIHMPKVGPNAGTVFLEEMDLARGAEYAETCARVRGWSRPKRTAWGTTPAVVAAEVPAPAPMNQTTRGIWLGLMDASQTLEEAREVWARAAEAGEPQTLLDDLAYAAKALHVRG